MLLRLLLSTVVVFSSHAIDAAAQTTPSLGIFADAAGTNCNIEQTEEGFGELYIYADLGNLGSIGIQAAEFAVSGIPEAWTAVVVASPTVREVLWNPVQGGGTVNFTTCLNNEGARVLVCSIVYYAAGPVVENAQLTITKHHLRVSPGFQCPLVKICSDVPVELRVCATSQGAVINGSTCSVAVEGTAWSAVKRLFK